MRKRFLSLFCVLALCLTLLPVTALAAGGSYLALGDSITTGYAPGNTTVSSPFAGQVQAKMGYDSLSNCAVVGATTDTLKDALPSLSGDIAGASLITITIGGNDLMNALYGYLVAAYNTQNPTKPITVETLKVALENLSNPSNQAMLNSVSQLINGFDGSNAETVALDTFGTNLENIIDQIRQENPSAPIVIATQYNPYGHITNPLATGIVTAFENGVVHLNERITKVAAAKGLIVADVYTAFRENGGPLTNATFNMSGLALDANLDFHPNQAGHDLIAAVICAAIPPTLTAGTAARTSETAATVTFTSDKAGSCYYVAQDTEITLTKEQIASSGKSQLCTAGTNTIALDNLTADPWYVAVVVRDAAGNVSNILKVTIPAYHKSVYGISADTTLLDFGTITEGGALPPARTVTVTNTGDQPVTLNQPASTASFDVGALSKTALAAGETATVTVQPKTGLGVGAYDETLAISGTYSVRADVALRFLVARQPSLGDGSGSGGTSGGGSGTPTYSIDLPSRFTGGRVELSPRYAEKGEAVTLTATPDEGYELASLTVADSRGNRLDLTNQGGGKYTFTMPGGRVTVSASFRPVQTHPEALPFADMSQDAWYTDAVRYVYEKGLMTGTSATAFSPNMTTSRSMLAAILWRMAGSPSVGYAMDFSDVGGGQWYTEAVRWTASEGIVTGYGNGAFGTNDPITREQLAVMLYRFAQKQGYDVSIGESTNILSYTDAAKVAEYAIPAMQWAVGAGIINGAGDGSTLAPQGKATRAEAATMLMRFCEDFGTR